MNKKLNMNELKLYKCNKENVINRNKNIFKNNYIN